MTSKNLPLPHPLFDTQSFLNDAPSPIVMKYIEQLAIANAVQEYNYTKEFLLSYDGSDDTFTSYRREVERLLQWSWLVAKKPIGELNRNDIRNYIDFIQDPPITWIGTSTQSRFIDSSQVGHRIANNKWRPFVVKVPKALFREGVQPDKNNYQLSQKSLQVLFATLSTYFNYLLQEEYINSNPILLIRQKNRIIQKTQQQKVTRKLSRTQWQYVISVTKTLAEKNPDNERLYFMMASFYLLGLRISELADTKGRVPMMGHFAPDKDGRWWFTTLSKGNKLRDIAVPDEMITILKRYRLSLGLTPLPIRGEQTPLLNKTRGNGNLGTRQIRKLVQKCFDHAIAQLTENNQHDEAQDLTAATVHWLRHTAISADIEHRPREHVRDDAGHGNAATTEQYIDVDRKARHDSAKNKSLGE